MNKIILVLTVLLISAPSFGHSGRTDSNGGHNCSQKSIDKGLCTGYHYHGKAEIKPVEKPAVAKTEEKPKEEKDTK